MEYSGRNTIFLHFSDWKCDVRKLPEISNDVKIRTTCDRSHIRRSSVGIVQPFAAAPTHLFLSAVIVYSSHRVKIVRCVRLRCPRGLLLGWIYFTTYPVVYFRVHHTCPGKLVFLPFTTDILCPLLPTCLLDLDAFFYRIVFQWYWLFDTNFLLNIAPFSLFALILDHISAA